MKIRLIAYCPRCGSHSFRLSALRLTKDAIFRSVGLKPLRCRMCRFRFYSFDLNYLRSCLSILEGPQPEVRELESETMPSTLETAQRSAASAGLERGSQHHLH